jgi:hypothetical protein
MGEEWFADMKRIIGGRGIDCKEQIETLVAVLAAETTRKLTRMAPVNKHRSMRSPESLPAVNNLNSSRLGSLFWRDDEEDEEVDGLEDGEAEA